MEHDKNAAKDAANPGSSWLDYANIVSRAQAMNSTKRSLRVWLLSSN